VPPDDEDLRGAGEGNSRMNGSSSNGRKRRRGNDEDGGDGGGSEDGIPDEEEEWVEVEVDRQIKRAKLRYFNSQVEFLAIKRGKYCQISKWNFIMKIFLSYRPH
jgi:hypothetical protein